MEIWFEYSRFFTALIVILDPFAAIPIYLSLTHAYTIAERAVVARRAAVTVCVVLIASALLGESFLIALGTSLASFRVGGGIVLLLMALSMLHARMDPSRTTADETALAETKQTIAIVPLAIPLLSGPGSISTVIIEVHRGGSEYHIYWILGIIVVISSLLWLVLRLAAPIGQALGPIGLNILNRLFGLVLAAIAVEIMANGLKQLFPVLAG